MLPDVNNLDQLFYPSSSTPDINDLDQLIAIRKGIRECTKNPLYPIANFISFQKFSPSHEYFS
jgi:hypothetical protein